MLDCILVYGHSPRYKDHFLLTEASNQVNSSAPNVSCPFAASS